MNSLHRRGRQEGMTLIEIMIVIAILGLLASIIGVAVMKNLQEARIGTAQTQIKDFESALQLYNRDCGKYPGTAAGLSALVANPGSCPRWKGYLASNTIPNDPWGNPYEYFFPGTHGQEMEIISKGPDGELNTQDDVVSWSTEAGGQIAGGGNTGGGTK
jgi:general secretion pathway protein G